MTKDKHETGVVGRYEIDVVPNEYGGYYARIPDFPTIFTGGQTMKNALEAVEPKRTRRIPWSPPEHPGSSWAKRSAYQRPRSRWERRLPAGSWAKPTHGRFAA